MVVREMGSLPRAELVPVEREIHPDLEVQDRAWSPIPARMLALPTHPPQELYCLALLREFFVRLR
jgi:hypothetical protein